jgi:hypothetical protein
MSNNIKLTEKCKTYFELFSKKDLDEISHFFSDDVVLRDWETLAIGKEQVLAANKNIFNNVNKIQVKLINQSLSHNNRVYNEIVIEINDEETLLVIDVIVFDEKGLIKKIEAYKG